MTWVIFGVNERRKDEEANIREAVKVEWDELIYEGGYDVTIENLRENCLRYSSHEESRSNPLSVSRSDACKIYALFGVSSQQLTEVMQILEDTLREMAGIERKYYFRLGRIPCLLLFPLVKSKVVDKGHSSDGSELKEKCRMLVKILSYLYCKDNDPWVILISGTSGSGKSTISSNLSYYLNAKCILQTDSIRHILASTRKHKDEQVLRYSSYQIHRYITDNKKEFKSTIGNEDLAKDNPILSGYLLQSYTIEDYIFGIVESHIKNKKSIIVEGVHITHRLFRRINRFLRSMNTADNGARTSICTFVIYIESKAEHMRRFHQRGKGLLDSKYSENINGIREIQNYLISTIGRENNVECIDNTSNDIDKVIQEHLFKHVRNLIFSTN